MFHLRENSRLVSVKNKKIYKLI